MMRRFDPAAALRLIEQEHVTRFYCRPYHDDYAPQSPTRFGADRSQEHEVHQDRRGACSSRHDQTGGSCIRLHESLRVTASRRPRPS